MTLLDMQSMSKLLSRMKAAVGLWKQYVNVSVSVKLYL